MIPRSLCQISTAEDAARRLRDGGVLAFPTETFYGLGCCADQAVAVARVYQAKRRPVHMPLPLLAGSLDLLRPYVTLEQAPEALLTAFWPGPLTVVLTARLTPLEGRRPLAPQLVNPKGKAAVRLTPHPLAAQLSRLAGAPLTASSANISGQAAARVPDELDERLLATPSIALERCRVVTNEMADVAAVTLRDAAAALQNYTPELAQAVREGESKTDHYEDILGTYLVKLSALKISENDSSEAAMLLKALSDFERIGDHALNLVESAEELKSKNLALSDAARHELNVLLRAVEEIVDMTFQAFRDDDLEKAYRVEPLEQVIDDLKEKMRIHHILRMQQGSCSIESGFVWSDLLTALERVGDHCSNIAGCIIDLHHHNMNTHEAIRSARMENENFDDEYKAYAVKYSLK